MKPGFIIYTTAIGGVLQVIWGDWALYVEMKLTRLAPVDRSYDKPPPPKQLYMVAFAEPGQIWDFVKGGAR